MPVHGRRSLAALATADKQLQIVFEEAIRIFDHSILFGHRTKDEQFGLYQQGRQLVNGIWTVVDPSSVVTKVDGITRLSMHNHYPSRAVDAVPYPIDWGDRERAVYFAGMVMGIAHVKGVGLRWGGDWDQDTEVRDENFRDWYHFELIE